MNTLNSSYISDNENNRSINFKLIDLYYFNLEPEN